MKYTINIAAARWFCIIQIWILFSLFIQTTSCQTQEEKRCVSISQPVTINFEGEELKDMRFSPFEEGKVWVQGNNQSRTIWEIDNISGQKVVLEPQKSKFFYSDHQNGHIQYRQTDQYDSLVWLGGPNRNVVFYDQRTKTINELPVMFVTRIIPKPQEVFFVSFQGFCYWDRQTKSISRVPDIPLTFIQQSVMPNDSTIILDREYTYFFNSKRTIKGIFSGKYDHKNSVLSYNEKDGLGVFAKNDSLWYEYAGISKRLPLPYNNTDATTITHQQYWQSDQQSFYAFDPKSAIVKQYNYRLPRVNNYSISHYIDDQYIWITRPGQVMLIDLSDHSQIEFPVQADEQHISILFDACNVYTLYKSKLVMMSKAAFIKKCLPFDVRQYELDLTRLEFMIDSLGILKDTLPSSVLSKLNDLKNRYTGVHHVEILKRLNDLDIQAFQEVRYKSPDGFIDCYKDKSMPLPMRKLCLQSLADQYGWALDFNSVIRLEQEFIKYFGAPDIATDYDFIRKTDSVKTYLSTIDKLKKSQLSGDSLYYFKSLALETICMTSWHCQDGCAGCDFSLVTDRLKSLPGKYPQSQLIDNVALYLLDVQYMHDYGDEELLLVQNQEYETFLKKYPDSDVRADVQFYIFMNWASMRTLNHRKIKTTAQRFMDEFGEDHRVTEVKQKLTELHIK